MQRGRKCAEHKKQTQYREHDVLLSLPAMSTCLCVRWKAAENVPQPKLALRFCIQLSIDGSLTNYRGTIHLAFRMVSANFKGSTARVPTVQTWALLSLAIDSSVSALLHTALVSSWGRMGGSAWSHPWWVKKFIRLFRVQLLFLTQLTLELSNY